MRKPLPLTLLLVLAGSLTVALGWPAEAFAQRRGPARGGHVFRSVVVVGTPFYPRVWYYDPWFHDPSYQYPGPYPPYGRYPYRYAMYDDLSASLRLEVEPREAEVFVDGYFAGYVDDFDGIFQRLHVSPGEHEISIYLDGYRTYWRNLYLSPRSGQRIRHTLERLGAGEAQEARPEPVERPRTASPTDPRQRTPRPTEPAPRPPVENARYGTLSLRVQPVDAEILIDGERWPAGDPQSSLLAIRLSEGRHRIEIRKDGYETFSEEIALRAGRTFTLNVSLKKKA